MSLKLELGWVKVGRSAKLKKDSEVHRTLHRTLSRCVRCSESARLHSPDAGTVSLQRPVLTRRALGHRTLRPAFGGHRRVTCRFENLSAHESGATLGASGDPAAGAYNPHPGVSTGSFPFLFTRQPAPAPCPSSREAPSRRLRVLRRPCFFSLAPDPPPTSPFPSPHP